MLLSILTVLDLNVFVVAIAAAVAVVEAVAVASVVVFNDVARIMCYC